MRRLGLVVDRKRHIDWLSRELFVALLYGDDASRELLADDLSDFIGDKEELLAFSRELAAMAARLEARARGTA